MSDSILKVENLSIDIPLSAGMLHAVDNISLRVDRGETLCIVGESGSGKSLTSLAIMGLLPKKAKREASRIDLNGESLLGMSEAALSDIRGNTMGMIFQEPMTSLNPVFTIGNQMMEVLRRHHNVTRADAKSQCIQMLDRVGIDQAGDRLRQYPHQLSGGLRQRVMIAMSLLCHPELIIADEPTTALDVTIQAQILTLLKDLQNEFKMGMILITHDMGVVANIADRVAVMYAGQIVEEGPVLEIFDKPAHPYTRALMACNPIPGHIERGAPLGTIPGIVPSLVGDITRCRFSHRWTEASGQPKENPLELQKLPGAARSFIVERHPDHRVYFCSDECLTRSGFKFAEGVA
ncbi:MAG: ABC transporter ATP-binding protein [Pseudomonadota bacterium]